MALNSFAKMTIIVIGLSTLFLFVESQGKKKDSKVAEDERHSTDGGSSCRKLMLIMAKRMMKVLTNCTKEVKAQYKNNEADFQTHFQCTIKCFMGRVRMIDENGMLSNATFTQFMTDHLPDNYHELAYKVIKPCFITHEKEIDPTDKTCHAYGEFIKCLQMQASDRC